MRLHIKKVTSYFEVANEEGRIVAGGTADDSVGYFVNPTVVALMLHLMHV